MVINGLRLPQWLGIKEFTCQCRRPGINPWVGRIPWRRKWQPIPVFLPGKSLGQRSLAGYSAGVALSDLACKHDIKGLEVLKSC